MLKKSKLTTFSLLWLAFAALASATPVAIQFDVVSWDYPIMTGGRFGASINNGPVFPVFCVDYQNSISALNQNYSAYLSDSTNWATNNKTRFGTTASTGFNYLPAANLSSLDRYTMAAWLTTQYTYPASPTDNDLAIQAAIWTLLSQTGAAPDTSGFTPAQNADLTSWLNAAVALKGNASLFNNVQSEMRIVTSSDVSTAADRYHSGQQEYLYVVPEPGTYLLISGGLAALGLIRRKRS